jgi:hypothetical protein
LRNWNVADNESVPASRRDYALWRDGLSTITDLSAVEVEERSIALGAGPGQPETVANVTASTFALTRVPALMGRTLLEADERGDAQSVVVVGYDFWKNKLDGARDVVGRVIRISGTPVTIVGVMPRGYGFPQRNDVWRPLHLERIPRHAQACRMSLGGWRRAVRAMRQGPRWRRSAREQRRCFRRRARMCACKSSLYPTLSVFGTTTCRGCWRR